LGCAQTPQRQVHALLGGFYLFGDSIVLQVCDCKY
jgi:hypothetical protein